MKRPFKDKGDILDALQYVKAQVCFINHACTVILESDLPGPEIVFGMHLVIDGIENQIDDIYTALDDNVYEVKEVVTRHIPVEMKNC